MQKESSNKIIVSESIGNFKSHIARKKWQEPRLTEIDYIETNGGATIYDDDGVNWYRS
jgi:hypothetical protein